MAYENDPSGRVYPTVLESEDLLNIRANEVLGLASRGSPYREQRKLRVKSLTGEELKRVRSHLAKEANSFGNRAVSIEKCVEAKLRMIPDLPSGEAMPAKLEIRALKAEARWHNLRMALYINGIGYLDRMPK